MEMCLFSDLTLVVSRTLQPEHFSKLILYTQRFIIKMPKVVAILCHCDNDKSSGCGKKKYIYSSFLFLHSEEQKNPNKALKHIQIKLTFLC